MHLGAGDIAGLLAAGFVAGAINAAAGGGSLITFPSLVAVGYAPLVANVTNTVALCPGYLSAAYDYRRELRGQRALIVPLGLVSIAGAIGGALLLRVTPSGVFRAVAPPLVLLSCAMLAVNPALSRRAGQPARARPRWPLLVLQLPTAAYGAYFGAALGVIMLATLGAFVRDTLQRLNALKALLSLAINWVAAAYFVAFEPVRWQAILILAPTSLLGGRAGVRAARRLSDRTLRTAVIAFGVAAAAYLFTQV